MSFAQKIPHPDTYVKPQRAAQPWYRRKWVLIAGILVILYILHRKGLLG